MEEHDGVTAVWFDWEFEAQVQEEEGASVEIDCVLRSIRGAYGADGEGGGLPFDSRSPDLSHPLASLARVVDKTLSFRLDRRSGRVFKLAGLQAMAAPVLAGGAFGDTVATEAVTMRGYIVRSFANTYFERALDGVCHAAGDETPLRWRGARNAQKRFLSERHGEAAIGPISQTWRLHPSLRFELDGVAEFKDGRLVRAQVSQKLIGQLKGEKVIPVRATSLISWTVETKPLGSD
jgi:hypothetical protein